jgi:hypothetical protein
MEGAKHSYKKSRQRHSIYIQTPYISYDPDLPKVALRKFQESLEAAYC